MKAFSQLIIYVILCVAPLSCGFTRFTRSIPITNELIWDPVLQAIPTCCSFITSSDDVSCHEMVERILSETVDQRMNAFFEDFQKRYEDQFMQEYKWLDYTDGLTQSITMETIMEVRHLIDGMILPRPYCNHRGRIHEGRCSFYQYMNDVGVVGLHLNANNLLVNLEQNLLSFAKIAEDFFNNEQYEHAEAMAVFLIKQLIIPLIPTQHFHASRETFEQALIKASIVISEIEKLRGNMDHSATFALSIIRSYNYLGGIGSKVVDQAELCLFKLRLLLHTPSIPPSYEVSSSFRREMIEDLQLYLQTLQAKPSPNLPFSMLLGTVSATPFYLAHQGLNDKDVQVLVAEIFKYLSKDLTYVAPHVVQKPKDRPLRIGFISNHFRDHSIGRIMIEVMNMMRVMNHPLGSADNREIYVYSICKKFVPKVVTAEDREIDEELDHIASQMKAAFGTKFVRYPMNVHYIREQVAKDELDVLVFADIGMDFVSYLLSFARLAKLQAVFWGHPITTGLDSIDYYLSLDDEVPHADKFYTEQMVRMNYINTIPLPVDYSENVTANHALLTTLELPLDAKIAVVLGRQFKMHPTFLRLLFSLLAHLQSIDAATGTDDIKHVVVLFAESIVDFNRIIVLQIENMLMDIFPENPHHVHRIMKHLRIFSFRHYFSVSKVARVALDTFPYGGCITAHDAFFAGVPLVTLPPEHVRGRYAASLYRQMNYTELIASSDQDYLLKAVLLMTNDDYYEAAKHQVRRGFQSKMRKNAEVSREWIEFIYRAIIDL